MKVKFKRQNPLSGVLGPLGGILGSPSTPNQGALTTSSLPLLPLPSISLPLPRPRPTPRPSPSGPNDPTSPSTSSIPTPSSTVSSSTSSLSTSTSSSPSVQSTPKPSQSSPSSTSVITSNSNGVIVTVTVVEPVGSLAATPHASEGFFQNKVQVGIVFAIVGLVALASFVFLGYRFYKTVKKRQQRILEDEAQKAAGLDDEDVDEFPRRRSPTLPILPPLNLYVEKNMHARAPSHEMTQRSPIERSRSTRSEAYSLADSRQSTDTQTLLLSSVGGTAAPRRSNTMSTVHSPTSQTFSHSSHSHSKPYYLSPDPFPPSLELPDTFGEDVKPPQPKVNALDDDQDYHAMMGRVLKITNE